MRGYVHILERRGAQRIPGAIVLVSLGALAVAFTAEHGFEVEPCILCVYQRVAYALAAVLGIVALFPRVSPQIRILLIASCGIALFGGAVVALYQVGLQQHWWTGFTACSGGLPAEMSLAELKAGLTKQQPARCDEVDWAMFGVSVATYNVGLFSLFAFGSMWAARTLWVAGGHAVSLGAFRTKRAPQWLSRRGMRGGQAGEREIDQPIPSTIKAGWSPSVASILPTGIMPPIWRRASRRDSSEVDASPYREPRHHGPSNDW